jgi:hypothetical protein
MHQLLLISRAPCLLGCALRKGITPIKKTALQYEPLVKSKAGAVLGSLWRRLGCQKR